jgi:glycosyltransferase involved in cell wall biosynthesis
MHATAYRINGLSIFFPCYNDGGTIASMVLAARAAAEKITNDFEIIVVDDGSTDFSRELLTRMAQKGSQNSLRLVFHEQNRGYGGALRSGFKHAAKEWIFYTDGDAQYDPRELEILARAAGPDVDIVQGYKIKRHDPLHRIIIGRIYHWMMKLMFGLRVRDVDCDFRLIRRSVFSQIHLTQNSGVICLEMMKKMQHAGCRFSEVPVSHFHRTYGKSQFFNFRRIFAVGIGVIRLWWKLVILQRYDGS